MTMPITETKELVWFQTDTSKKCVGVSSFVRHFPNTHVPCGSCSACCRSEFDLNLNQADDPSLYLTEIGQKTGRLSLKKTADGACVYLQDGKCSIYDRRPITCRKFDCRTDVLCCLKTPDLYNTVAWDTFDFTYNEPTDKLLRQCVCLLARLLAGLASSNAAAAQNAVWHMRAALKRESDVIKAYNNIARDVLLTYRTHGLLPPPAPRMEDI
jgi:hypothetical protein